MRNPRRSLSVPKTDESPYEAIWTWLGSATVGFSVLSFLTLTTGSASYFPNTDALVQDDRKATVAYYGILVCAVALAALGIIAVAFARSKYARKGMTWPRFRVLEGKKRTPLIARVAFASVLLPPFGNVVASLIAYFKTSQIATWDAPTPLADGFLGSRMAAWGTDCSDQPCFRFAPKDGIEPFAHQWFFVSDMAVAIALLTAATFWGVFLTRVARMI